MQACLCACQFLLNLKCSKCAKPELIRWEQEIVERRKNWGKPLIDTELSWEICSHFVGSAESHSQYKACLFITARAFSSATHTYSHTHSDDRMCLDKTSFMPDLRELPLKHSSRLSPFIQQCSSNPQCHTQSWINFVVFFFCRKPELWIQTETTSQSCFKTQLKLEPS